MKILNFFDIVLFAINLSDPDLWWTLIILLIIGLIAIVTFGFLLAFPFASLAGIAVFVFTGSLLWSGVTFLLVALNVAAIGKASRGSRREKTVVYQEHTNHED